MDTEKANMNPTPEKLFLLWDSVKRITSEPDTTESTFRGCFKQSYLQFQLMYKLNDLRDILGLTIGMTAAFVHKILTY